MAFSALIKTKYPSGREVENDIDNDGVLAKVKSKKASETVFRPYANNFKYTAAGAIESFEYGNGRFETMKFNSRLQPVQIGLGYSAANQGLLKLDYEYNTGSNADNNGNVLKQTITVPSVGQNNGFTAVQTYTYDELNRLKTATENMDGSQTPSWQETNILDRYGNKNFDEANTTTITKNCVSGSNPVMCDADREVENPEIDPATNRIKELQPDGDQIEDYEFDAAGNTTKDPSNRRFKYDGENKQIEVVQLDANGNESQTPIGQYWFDGDGKRVKKYVPSTGETTIFHYDAGGKLIAEYSTVVETANPQVSYLTNDHLGSPRITTDKNGNVFSRRDFLPFGEELKASHTSQRNTGVGYAADSVRQKFTGYERDNESSLDFAEARYFAYNHGRFTSVDPIMMTKKRLLDPQSINLYVYTRNNPLKYIDPTGEEFKGTDGKKVLFEEKDGQIVIVSSNATKDLIKLVGLINNSGSSTALSQFNKLNAHKTMVNLTIDPNRNNTFLYGLHQPHGTRPDGSKGALRYNSDTDKFEGTPDIAKDANGNEVYAEATITLFEGELSNAVKNDRNELETQMVGTFVHEAEHDLDPNQVQMAKTGKGDHRSWHPEKLYKLQNDTIREIREMREFRNRPRCPRGHMCF